MAITNKINQVISNVQNKIPSIRSTRNTRIAKARLTPYNQPATSQTTLQNYYDTLNNLYIQRCCEVYKDTALSCGFTIDTDTRENDDLVTTGYLNRIFNNPEGIDGDLTWSSANSLIWDSFLVLGDCFFDVSTDNNYNIFNGFKYIPNTEIYYNTENDCYSLIHSPKVEYGKKDIVHIYSPNPDKRYSKFGVSLISSTGGYLALLINALTYNNEVLSNDGLDPNAYILFDNEVDDDFFDAELDRLEAQMDEKTTSEFMALKGASIQTVNKNNKDMMYLELMKFCRDAILSRFAVPPQKAGIIENANLGSGSGESQDKDWKKTFDGRSCYVTDAFNNCLKQHGFTERFSFNPIDVVDELYDAQVAEIYLRNGVLDVEEVRNKLGLDSRTVSSWQGYYR